MTQKNADGTQANDPPLLHKDIWFNCIFPLLDRRTLLRLASTSKEARQLVFENLFRIKSFSTSINQEIKNLTDITDNRYASGAPPIEFELNVKLGGNREARLVRLGQGVGAVIFSYLAVNALNAENLSATSKLFIALGLIGYIAAAEVAFQYTNLEWVTNNYNEGFRQEELHRKKYGLTYLRDELPGLKFPSQRLFAKPYGQSEADVPAKVADKKDLYYKETFFSKWKCIIHDLMYHGEPSNPTSRMS